MSPLTWTWKRRLWIACGFGFVALVIYLSLAPDPLRAPTVASFKTGHIVAYLWLMLWFAQLWASVFRRLVIGVLLCLLGVALEYAQGLTGYRTFAYSDMLDNAIGVAVGFAVSFMAPLRIAAVLERRRVARQGYLDPP